MREDCIFSFEEIRLAVNVAERVRRGEERVFTFEESMADLEDAQQGAEALEAHKQSGDATIPLDQVCRNLQLKDCIFSFEETHLNISLAPDSGAERSERITRLRNSMQRAEVILESGTVEAMTSQEVQEEIDAWRSERSESAMASILRGPLAAEVKAAMSSPSTPLRVYYKESP